MEFLANGHDEWLDMWADLADYPMNNGDSQCPNMGAQWEYMGSTADHHHFKHNMHPVSERTEYAYLERRRKALGWV